MSAVAVPGGPGPPTARNEVPAARGGGGAEPCTGRPTVACPSAAPARRARTRAPSRRARVIGRAVARAG
jgi:hypothetical protein